jgi:hypothetical protein
MDTGGSDTAVRSVGVPSRSNPFRAARAGACVRWRLHHHGAALLDHSPDTLVGNRRGERLRRARGSRGGRCRGEPSRRVWCRGDRRPHSDGGPPLLPDDERPHGRKGTSTCSSTVGARRRRRARWRCSCAQSVRAAVRGCGRAGPDPLMESHLGRFPAVGAAGRSSAVRLRKVRSRTEVRVGYATATTGTRLLDRTVSIRPVMFGIMHRGRTTRTARRRCQRTSGEPGAASPRPSVMWFCRMSYRGC